MNFSLTIQGTAELQRVLTRLGPRANQASQAALYQEATSLLNASKEQLVPVDLGALRASGQVTLPEVQGTVITDTVGYGNDAVKYAVSVHENPRAGATGGISPQGKRYQHWAKVGTWKYLERAALAAIPGLEARLGATLRKDLDRAAG